MLIGYHAQDKLLKIIPVIFVVAIGNPDGAKVLLVIIFIVTTDAETGGICVEQMGAEFEFFHNFHDDLVEEIGGSMLVDEIQCPKENVIVEMLRGDYGSE